MPSHLATLIFVAVIAGLFALDRDRDSHTSRALWIPVVWMLIALSRPVSAWLAAIGLGDAMPVVDGADQYLEGSPLDRNCFAVLLAIGLIVLIARRHQVGILLRGNLPIVVFLSYCLLSILWSDYPDVAFKRWTKAIGDFVMVLIVFTDPEPLNALKKLLTRTGFILIPLSVLFIKYYPDLGRTYNQWTWVPTVVGVTTGKNLLGMTCLVLGLGSVWRFVLAYRNRDDARRTRVLFAHGTFLVMTAWLFSAADSMTSLSCFLIGSVLIVGASLTVVQWRAEAVHALVVFLVLGAVFALFFNPGGELVESLGRDATLTGRTAIWQMVLGMSGNPLIGRGYESFWLGDRLHIIWQHYEGLNEAHNGYIDVFLNLGWIGVSLLVAVILAGYRSAVAGFRVDPGFGGLRIAYLVVAVVYNFTEAAFRELNPIWIFFLIAITAPPAIYFAQDSSDCIAEPEDEREPQADYVLRSEIVGQAF